VWAVSWIIVSREDDWVGERGERFLKDERMVFVSVGVKGRDRDIEKAVIKKRAQNSKLFLIQRVIECFPSN